MCDRSPQRDAAELRAKTLAEETRALEERAANERAFLEGRPLPHPNPWDALDPTKRLPGSPPEEIRARYEEFLTICRPRPRKKHVL